MDAKSYLMAAAFVVAVGQHRYASAGTIDSKTVDCDDPTMPDSDTLDELTSMDGFEHEQLKVLYNEQAKRTEFVSVVLDKDLLRDGRSGCTIHRNHMAIHAPDDAGHIVADRLGGSCNEKNVFPQNMNCNRGMWKSYEGSVAKDVKRFGRVKYCVQLVYPDRYENRPVKIMSSAYTYPENRHLDSITIDNPPAGHCHRASRKH